MPPPIATAVFVVGIGGLFLLDRDTRARTSIGLWIPVIWVLIAGSRSLSEWQTVSWNASSSASQYLEGNPLDRNVLMALLALALIVLVQRGPQVGRILRANAPILLFFLYCGVSILWSDYPDVAFKRWTKSLSDLSMVLIVLTEGSPVTAVKRLLARTGFVLIPVSILLIKYYPDLGRGYRPWVWIPYYTGVTTEKNLLGMVCLIFGLGFVWRFLETLHSRKDNRRLRRLCVFGALLAMLIWLFWMADSMTSLSCFLMASGLMAVTSIRATSRKTWLVHILVAGILLISFSTLFLDVGSGLLGTVGRDPTLTGRTEIWHLVLGMTANPVIGTGFESFWLGKRLEKIWSFYWWHPNEAHDGYLEVYLNLGWIGVALLAVVLVTGYRNVITALRRDPDTGKIRLAYFVVAVAYNLTESAIRTMNPVWIFFLLAITAVPGGWTRAKTKKAAALPILSSEEPLCLEEV